MYRSERNNPDIHHDSLRIEKMAKLQKAWWRTKDRAVECRIMLEEPPAGLSKQGKLLHPYVCMYVVIACKAANFQSGTQPTLP